MPNFMKICLLEAKLFHADGRTDREIEVTKLIVAFSNFANSRSEHKVDSVRTT
jgi:hypothetical protein